MGRRWKLQRGNTSRFSFGISFEDDPDEGEGATPEMAASWGSFELWVDGLNLCAQPDDEDTIQAVHWYLLPLLEWLAENWQPLFHEEKLPVRNAADSAAEALRLTAFPPLAMQEAEARVWESNWYAWRSRHSLDACREGGLFPDVTLRRYRDGVEVSWEKARIAGAPAHHQFFAEKGVARLSPEHVAKPLFEVLQGAAAFLAAELPASERVAALVKRIESLPLVSADVRLAWMVGLGVTWTAMEESWRKLRHQLNQWSEAATAVLYGDTAGERLFVPGSCQVALMFGSTSPTLRLEDALTMARLGVGQYRANGRAESALLRGLVREAPWGSEEPWENGYRLALELLEALGIDPETAPRIDVDHILRRLGIRVTRLDLSDPSTRAIAMAGPYHRPVIALNNRSPFNSHLRGQRFTKAHELCHLLHDRADGKPIALVSGPWAPLAVERRANAFAAMLLMPEPTVRRALKNLHVHVDSGQGIREIAAQLDMNPVAVTEHVGNLQGWDLATRERVRAELEGD